MVIGARVAQRFFLELGFDDIPVKLKGMGKAPPFDL